MASLLLMIPRNGVPAWRLDNCAALSSRSMTITTNKTIMLSLHPERTQKRLAATRLAGPPSAALATRC